MRRKLPTSLRWRGLKGDRSMVSLSAKGMLPDQPGPKRIIFYMMSKLIRKSPARQGVFRLYIALDNDCKKVACNKKYSSVLMANTQRVDEIFRELGAFHREGCPYSRPDGEVLRRSPRNHREAQSGGPDRRRGGSRCSLQKGIRRPDEGVQTHREPRPSVQGHLRPKEVRIGQPAEKEKKR